MRILLSFQQDLTVQPHPVPAYRFWSYYIRQGIEEAGMHWLEIPGVDWAAGLVPYEDEPALGIWKVRAWELTVKFIKENRASFDVFLCYLYPKQVDMSAINEIKALGVPCVNFYCDNVREFTTPPPEFKVFDLMWVPEFEALEMYRRAKINHIHLPMPMWVAPVYRNLPVNENGKISFIGSKDVLRARLLMEVIESKLDIQIRGEGWSPAAEMPISGNLVPHRPKLKNQLRLLAKTGFKGFLIHHLNRVTFSDKTAIPGEYIFAKPDFEEYISLTRNSNIVLGINRVPIYREFGRTSLVYSRLRDIEAPMIGACYLTEYTPGLKGLYELGKEIETYTNAEELTAQCREIGSSASRRMALRKLGQQKALTSLSIPQSLQKIMERLFKEAGA
ncbi:glycosyltransferase [Mucilaginibacter flavus]|uniref:glycosyltransferase family protein n=1 Tax=Mucilaginibacter flavus TaxID=931504 RepID=UPI0025B614B7|nr:glycosyltransferase [Mucilaginibacter flavus]MDN3584422.1 glycosyltransferase [Mucilaginibacter flavus]